MNRATGETGSSTTGRESPRSARSLAQRWEEAETAAVAELEGDWHVERLTGPVPMPFVWKQVHGGRGRTMLLPRSSSGKPLEPGLPFVLRGRAGHHHHHVELRYGGPFFLLHDELRREPDGGWLGKAFVAGARYGWFRMSPVAGGGGNGEVRLR